MAPPIKPTGNALVNAKTGERKWFPQSMVKDAILSQEWVGQPGDRMYVMEGGEAKVIDAGNALTAFAEMGYEPRSEEHIRWEEKDVRLEEKYGDSPIRAAGESLLRAGTFGGSDWLAVQLGASREGLKEREARTSGWITMPSTIAGIAGPAILTGGASLFAKGAVAGGAKGAVGLGAKGAAGAWVPKAVAESAEYAAHVVAAKEAGKGFLRGRTLTEKIARLTPAGAADVAGRNLGRLLVPAGERIAGGSLVGKGAGAAIGFMAIPGRTAPRALQAAAEGGLYGIGEAISVATLNNDPITAEAIWATSKEMIITGAAFGGGLSALWEGGRYLKGFHARRVRAAEELDVLQKDVVTKELIANKEAYVEQELAKVGARKAGEDLRAARKAEVGVERAHRKEGAALTKEAAAKEKELAKAIVRHSKEATRLEEAHAATLKDIKKKERALEKLGEEMESGEIRAKKATAQMELDAARNTAKAEKAVADEAKHRTEALQAERKRLIGEVVRDVESVNKKIQGLQKDFVKLQETNKQKILDLGMNIQKTQETLNKALETQRKVHTKLEGKKITAESLQIDKAVEDHQAALEKFLMERIKDRAGMVKAEQKLSKEIAEETIAPISGGSKLTERLAVVRNTAEDWRGMGHRLTGKPGQGKLPVIEEMDPLIKDSAREIHRAIHAFDEIYTTQQRIGSPNVRRYGKYEQEIRPTLVTEGPRFDRTIFVDEKYMDGLSGPAHKKMAEALQDLEEAVRVHQRNVTELADNIGYNKEAYVGRRRWPKYLDDAYGAPTQYTAFGYMQDLRTSSHPTVIKALKKRGKHADEVAGRAELEEHRLIAEEEKIAGWKRQLAIDLQIEAKEATRREIDNLEKLLRSADDNVKKSGQEALDAKAAYERAPGEVAKSEMDAKMEIAQTYFGERADLKKQLNDMAGKGKIDTSKLDEELDDLYRKRAEETEVSKAEGTLSDVQKEEVVHGLKTTLADVRRKANVSEDLRMETARKEEELRLLGERMKEQPGIHDAEAAVLREDLKSLRDKMDESDVQYAADIKEAKSHVAMMVAAKSIKEAEKIIKMSVARFGKVEEGGTAAARKAAAEAGATTGTGHLHDMLKSGVGNVAYHQIRSAVGGIKGWFLAAFASTAVKRVMGKPYKTTRKGRIDVDAVRRKKLVRDYIFSGIGSVVGLPGQIVKMPAYSTATIGMLDAINFGGIDIAPGLEGATWDFSDPTRKPPESRAEMTPAQKAYREKVQQLRNLMANPEALMDRLNDATGRIREFSPKVATEVANNEFRRIMYVASKIPQTPPVGYAGSDYSEYLLPDSKIAKFAMIAYAAYEPLSVISKLTKGTLTAAEGEAFRNTSPELFALAQEALIEKLGDPKAKKMSFAQRLQMSLFLGRPTDTVLRSIQGRQKIFDEEAQQQQQPQVDLSQVKQSVQNQETNTQRRAAK